MVDLVSGSPRQPSAVASRSPRQPSAVASGARPGRISAPSPSGTRPSTIPWSATPTGARAPAAPTGGVLAVSLAALCAGSAGQPAPLGAFRVGCVGSPFPRGVGPSALQPPPPCLPLAPVLACQSASRSRPVGDAGALCPRGRGCPGDALGHCSANARLGAMAYASAGSTAYGSAGS